MGITLGTVVHQNPDLVGAEVDGYTMLMSVEAGKYFSLNPVGGRIWEMLQTPTPVGEICAALQSEFDVGEEQCRSEVLEFLGRLGEQGLVCAQD